MKKIVSVLMILTLLVFSTNVFASFLDVPKGAVYEAAMNRVTALGIMNAVDGQFKPGEVVSREAFAKIMVILAGVEDKVSSLSASSIYSDVDSKNVFIGYINAAVQKGYITGMVDGKFHPKDAITYAQVCTAMVKVLGYTDQDVPGLWPKNYMEKAKFLHISEGVTLSSTAKVSKSSMAVMIDNLLDVTMKKSSTSEPDKTLASSIGLTNDSSSLIYSKPEVVSSSNTLFNILGRLDLSDYNHVVRNTIDISTNPAINKIGESISMSQIKDKDVVYQIIDKANKKYILVVDHKVTGKIAAIKPDKFSPNTIQIDNTDYSLSRYMNLNKINSTSGSYNIGDSVSLLLGYDNKVVDIQYPETSDNSNYAFVVNTGSTMSTDLADYGKVIYSAKLLLTDGSIATYKTETDPADYKGKLVTFIKKLGEEVQLQPLNYVSMGEVVMKKDDRSINGDYVTDNVKVYNLISNDSGLDAQVNLVNWSDLPSGTITASKILYFNKAGSFNDINVLLLNDIFDQQYKMGVVKKIDSSRGRFTYTLVVDGKDYSYSMSAFTQSISEGAVFKVKIVNGAISEYRGVLTPDAKAVSVDAIDTKRIKVNNTIYRFKDNAVIYYKNTDRTITIKGINDIETNKVYGQVYVYTDRSEAYNGKAEVIVISALSE